MKNQQEFFNQAMCVKKKKTKPSKNNCSELKDAVAYRDTRSLDIFVVSLCLTTDDQYCDANGMRNVCIHANTIVNYSCAFIL